MQRCPRCDQGWVVVARIVKTGGTMQFCAQRPRVLLPSPPDA
jgi:hypothetical protein